MTIYSLEVLLSWFGTSSLFHVQFYLLLLEWVGQNTGVGSLSLLWGIFPTQSLNPGLPHCRWIIYQLSHKRNMLFFRFLVVYVFMYECVYPSIRLNLYQYKFISIYLYTKNWFDLLPFMLRIFVSKLLQDNILWWVFFFFLYFFCLVLRSGQSWRHEMSWKMFIPILSLVQTVLNCYFFFYVRQDWIFLRDFGYV